MGQRSKTEAPPQRRQESPHTRAHRVVGKWAGKAVDRGDKAKRGSYSDNKERNPADA